MFSYLLRNRLLRKQKQRSRSGKAVRPLPAILCSLDGKTCGATPEAPATWVRIARTWRS